MSKLLKWRSDKNEQNNFKSKISFLDMAKKSSFFDKKFSKKNSSPYKNVRKQPEEKRSFNKKIIIEKKGPKSYKETFGSITSNVKFTKPTKSKTTYKKRK